MNGSYRTEYGTTLLELCISLTLVGIVLSATTLTFKYTVQWFGELRKRLSTERAVIESFAHFERAFMALDASRSSGLWKIHQGGRFFFAYGAEHPISKLKGTSQPRTGSDGLSILEVMPSGTLAVTHDSAQGVTFCPLYISQQRIEGVRSFIKRSVHGDAQYSFGNELRGAVWPSKCGSITGSPIQGISIKKLEREIAGQIILPVLQEYSLFVDRSSHLRLISHRGGWIRENQPLVNGIQTLAISSTISTRGILRFTVVIKTVSGIERTWSRVSTLARSEGYNDLLL